jgi:hypothetical protein
LFYRTLLRIAQKLSHFEDVMRQSLVRMNPTLIRLVASLSVAGCLLTKAASAAIVPLVPGDLQQGFPDVTVSRINVTYDAGTDLFHAAIPAGGLLTIDQDGVLPTPDHTLFDSTFDVSLTIDDAGVASVGTLSLSGNYDSPGGPAVSLGSSTLTGFGYDPSTGIFSFLFDGTTGTLPGFGSVIGINLAGNFPVSNPTGFGDDFSNIGPNGGLGTADLFVPVPEPASLIVWSLCSALAGLAHWRHKRRRQIAN